MKIVLLQLAAQLKRLNRGGINTLKSVFDVATISKKQETMPIQLLLASISSLFSIKERYHCKITNLGFGIARQ